MKLLIATHYFESHRGGIEIVAGRMAREFARVGMDVAWLATDSSAPPDTSREPRLRCIPLAAANIAERRLGIPYPLPTVPSLRRLVQHVAASDAVLVHDALYVTSIAAFVTARLLGKPIIVVQHIGAVPYRSRVLYRAMELANRLVARPILARADQTVFISESTVKHFTGLRFRTTPVVIFNGVDTAVFSPPSGPAEIAAARRALDLPHDRPIALFVGRFVEKKGLAVLERLARARPDVTFACAGWGPLDPRAWHLANVHVFDTLAGPSLAPLYRASDVLVLPSSGEGFPLVVQEALACGLRITCGEETAGADPAASPLITGVPIDTSDADRTAMRFDGALAAELRQPADDGARSSRAAFARQHYSWESATARYGDILHRLLSRMADPTAARQAAASLRNQR